MIICALYNKNNDTDTDVGDTISNNIRFVDAFSMFIRKSVQLDGSTNIRRKKSCLSHCKAA